MNEQSPFAAALTRPDAAIPAGLRSWNGSDVGHRFGVYRNNVVVSLTGALRNAFPVVHDLVGAEFFAAAARGYISIEPPRSPVLAHYGTGFPAFLGNYAPAAELAYLADVARLEAARIAAFHAADAQVVAGPDFAAISPEALPGARITLHPAARLLRSSFAIGAIWSAHQGVGELADVDPFEPEDVLVTRPDWDVMVTRLAPGVAEALVQLQSGQDIGSAVEVAAQTQAAFEPTALFVTLINSGAVTAITMGDVA